MKSYNVHFSFYSLEYGDFEEIHFKVEAENQFEARRKAWLLCDNNEDMAFARNIRLCGVTWEATPLDMQDYFNALASYEKYQLALYENVHKNNAQISGQSENDNSYGDIRLAALGSLSTINEIAKDFGAAYGMLPPRYFDELHYADALIDVIDKQFGFDGAMAFIKLLDKAKKWDNGSLFSLAEIFQKGYMFVNDEYFSLANHFSKDGFYPVGDLNEKADYYIRRWRETHKCNSLEHMPFYDERHIVEGSQSMNYVYKILVLNKSVLPPEQKTPINGLWFSNNLEDTRSNADPKLIEVKNLITGETAEYFRSDFLGVLKPEIEAKLDDEAIRNEYTKHIESVSNEYAFDEDEELEM